MIAAPGFQADPSRHGTHSEGVGHPRFGAQADPDRRHPLRFSEMKKSVFSALNYELPRRGVFPMHCAANVSPEGDVALFFGLSGTGENEPFGRPKTAPHRR